jgi:hypothetical protein
VVGAPELPLLRRLDETRRRPNGVRRAFGVPDAGGIGHGEDALLTAIIGYVDDEGSVRRSTPTAPSNGAVTVGRG